MLSAPRCYRCRAKVGPHGALVTPEPQEYEPPTQRLITIPPLWFCGMCALGPKAYPNHCRVQLVLIAA